jgi:predicted DNA-binding transcriptional regulator AlpA
MPVRSTALPDSFPDENALMSHADVCRLCGGVSTMTIWRWRQDAELNFPAPTIINERCYWPCGEVVEWLKQQRALSADRKRELAKRARPAPDAHR